MRYRSAILLLMLADCGKPLTTAERFSGPWLAPSPIVMRALLTNQIRGCGEFYMRRAKDSENNPAEYGDYLIYCTSDGKTWVAWEVFPSSNQVLGPSMLEPEIPLPDRAKISN